MSRRLPRRIDSLPHALSQGTVMIDPREAQIGKRQPLQAQDRLVGTQDPGAHVLQELAQGWLIHC
jgi:hypothetical protein